MFLFQKQQLALFVDKKRLLLLGSNPGEKEELEFTKDEVKDGEVVDKEKFIGSIVSFLAKSSFKKQKITCVLLEDLLHQKTMSFADKETVRKEAEEFFKKIYLSEEKRVSKTLTDDKNIYLIATNKDFYAPILAAFEYVGWGIKAVVPISVFYREEEKKKEVSYADADYVVNNKKLIEVGDLLTEEGKTENKASSGDINLSFGDSDEKNSRMFLLGLVGFVILGIVIGLFLFGALKYPFAQTNKAELTKTESITPTSSPTPTVVAEITPSEELAKSATVQVLNGTGIAGQAAKASNIIKEIGFEDVKTGNADTQDAKNTTVVFSSKIPKGVQKKIITELEKTFSKVVSKTSSGSADFDIVITTGKYSSQ